MLIFEHKDGRKIPVAERTYMQIYSVLSRYMRPYEMQKFRYIGKQRISPMNGNIYADFLDKDGNKHTFYIADYEDYISEII